MSKQSPNFIGESEIEMVVHIRAKNGSYHTTSYFPNVRDLLFETSPDYTGAAFDDLLNLPVPKRYGTRQRIAFTSAPTLDVDLVEVYHYDNTIDNPNLDHFLATFTKAQRLQMMKDYIDEQESRLEKFVEEFGAEEIRSYLDTRYPQEDLETR